MSYVRTEVHPITWLENQTISAIVNGRKLLFSEVFSGWEAGIRTPITWSRATCPTVERPPNGGGISDYIKAPSGDGARATIYDFAFSITPHAIRAPAFPVGSV